MTDCPIYLDGREVGRARWAKEGGYTRFWASCPFEEGYIYRLSIGMGNDTDELGLGVMMPEGARFILSKKISASKCGFLELSEDIAAHIDRRRPGEEDKTPPLDFAFSKLRDIRGMDTGCGQYIENIFGRSGGLFAEHMGIKYLVCPWEPGTELGPSGFFCLLTYFRYRDKGYCALCVDGEGKIFPVGQRN